MRLFRIKPKNGITLMELLIVVLIVGILAIIAVPKFTGIIRKAKKAEAYSVLGAVKVAVEAYIQEEDNYPGDLSELDLELPALHERYYKYSLSDNDPAGEPYIVIAHPTPELDTNNHPHLHGRGKIGVYIAADQDHTHTGGPTHQHGVSYGNPY